MNQISFGISQIKTKTPEVIIHILAASATILAAAKGLNMIYPKLVTTDVVGYITDFLAAVGVIAPLFGVKPTEPSETK